MEIYTNSGVSAGIGIWHLVFVAELLGYGVAKQLSVEIEYSWNEDSKLD